jgi:NADP-dependent 3-hydroxy acid dehydrogenase YdfG
MGKKLDGAVVVVTGASSGIGRATGLAFAERGTRVVVAARRVDALEELAPECQAAGGQALAVPPDTTDEAAVAELARRALGLDQLGAHAGQGATLEPGDVHLRAADPGRDLILVQVVEEPQDDDLTFQRR